MFCYRCGVQLNPNLRSCPLCDTLVPVESSTSKDHSTIELEWPTGFPNNTTSSGKSKKSISSNDLRLLISIALLSPLGPLFLIWFLQEPSQNWVLWLIAFFSFLWLALVPLISLRDYPVLFYSVLFFLSSAVLVGVDFATGQIDWSLKIALPISLMIVLSYVFISLISKYFKNEGLLYISSGIFCFSVVVSMIDGLINWFYGEGFFGALSILLVICVPISLCLLFLHFRLGWRLNVDAFFDV